MLVIVIFGCFYFLYQQLYDSLSAYSILSTNTVQRRNAAGNLALPKDLCLEMLSSVTDNIWEYERNMELWTSSHCNQKCLCPERCNSRCQQHCPLIPCKEDTVNTRTL